MALFPTTIEGYEWTEVEGEPALKFWGTAPPRALVNLAPVDEEGKEWLVPHYTKSKILRGNRWEITATRLPSPGTYDWYAVAHRLLIFEVGRSDAVTITIT